VDDFETDGALEEAVLKNSFIETSRFQLFFLRVAFATACVDCVVSLNSLIFSFCVVWSYFRVPLESSVCRYRRRAGAG
jgi:hypothetical protein